MEGKANRLYVQFVAGMKTGSDSLKARINKRKKKAISKSREIPAQFLNVLFCSFV